MFCVFVIILSGHFLLTIYCVAAIRNGLEAFQDGMIIKEVCMYDDDDVYLHRIHSQHKLENYAPYVKYRPAKKA
jgi:hypothetical protein